MSRAAQVSAMFGTPTPHPMGGGAFFMRATATVTPKRGAVRPFLGTLARWAGNYAKTGAPR